MTVPWEEHVEETHDPSKYKYDELLGTCQNNRWNASCTPIEVGSRGFVARSLCKALSDIGLAGTRKRKAIETKIKTTERTAKWLGLKRSSAWAIK